MHQEKKCAKLFLLKSIVCKCAKEKGCLDSVKNQDWAK